MSTQANLLLERLVNYSTCWVYTDDKKAPKDLVGYKAIMLIREDNQDFSMATEGWEENYDLVLKSYIDVANPESPQIILSQDTQETVPPEGEDLNVGLVSIYMYTEQINSLKWRTGHQQVILIDTENIALPFLKGTMTIK